jgi:hypothetical protein
LAACTSAILLHLAVKRTIETQGVPKPLAVLVGSNEDFPFFDAPVMSVDETRDFVRHAERRASSEQPRETPKRKEQHSYDGQRASARAGRYDQPHETTGFGGTDELAAIVRAAEQQISRVRKPKDILPALGTVGLFALTQYLGKRK